MLSTGLERCNTPVYDNGKVGEVAFKLIDPLAVEGGDLSILFRRQALQPSVSRMGDKHLAAALRDGTDKVSEYVVAVIVIDSQAVLDGYWNRYRVIHRGDTLPYLLRLTH